MLASYKPAAAARTHVLLAAVTWTVVGSVLATFGVVWALGSPLPYGAALLAVAIAAGMGKAWFVLRPAADRIVARIWARGDGRCLGGFVSWRSWLFIVVMMAGGRIARGSMPVHSPARGILGVVYAGVGAALVVAAVRLWGAWRHGPGDRAGGMTAD